MGNNKFEDTLNTIIQHGVSEYGQKRDSINQWIAEEANKAVPSDALRHLHLFPQLWNAAAFMVPPRLNCSEMIRVIREEKSQLRLYQEYNKIVDKKGIPMRLDGGELKDLANLISTLLDEAESVIYYRVQYPSNLRWAESCLECADELVNSHPNNRLLKERIERLKTSMFPV